MRKFLMIAVVMLAGLLPASLSAQGLTAPQSDMMDGMNVHKALAIGAGVIVGAAVIEAIALNDLFVLAGGIAGGFVGAWWYNNADEHGMPKMAIRETGATVMPAVYQMSASLRR
jgi:hypothetical protein